MAQSEESITRMASSRFPHHGYRSFAHAQDDAFRSSSLWRFPFPIVGDVLSQNRHSERGQECFVGRIGNGIVAQSEESITSADVLPFSSLRL